MVSRNCEPNYFFFLSVSFSSDRYFGPNNEKVMNTTCVRQGGPWKVWGPKNCLGSLTEATPLLMLLVTPWLQNGARKAVNVVQDGDIYPPFFQ